ncbi:uncharacterized protein K452DRAFT_310867 [Aplosporella prunicola CBS 121167]|uniref:SP-RING-type domain-containing protein n=1 Tax=Aplosporella prunicola CBS 121167 TaxID=1176127 RepID=A0A6A6B6G3_9PEZI|nr:uncharacterized protein K452DRAFT_310867 [Aplosporella prunicola CBS 121167]KAF2139456.1 hypothetical protein K452DRAFT_310867 [Aplosporella prunicola CBS 121167]
MSSRARSSTAGPSGSVIELPDYEPPNHPLNVSGQRALYNLLAQQYQPRLQQHLRDAAQQLTDSAFETNDRLCYLKGATRKRKERHPEPDEHDQSREEHLQVFQRDVDTMTKRIEEQIRKTIDGQETVKTLEETLRHVKQQAANNATASQRVTQTQRHRDDDDASEFDPTLPGTAQVVIPSSLFKQRVQSERAHYQALSLATRYAHHNDYKSFKRHVHEASYPEETAPPMPPEHTWFPSAGPPAPGTALDAAGDDSDDDIAIAMERISTKCPLTLQEFREPVMSTKCPHTFEKAAILDMIQRSGPRGRGPRAAPCPVSGCSEILTERDLNSDGVLVLKIRRIQKRKAEAAYEDDDDDEGGTSRRNNRAQSIDSDSGAEDIDAIERRQRIAESQAYTQRIKAERVTATPFAGGMDGAADMSTVSQVVDLGSEEDSEDE